MDPLELELWMVVRHCMGAWTEPGFFAGATRVLNCEPSLQPPEKVLKASRPLRQSEVRRKAESCLSIENGSAHADSGGHRIEHRSKQTEVHMPTLADIAVGTAASGGSAASTEQ